MPQIPTWQSPQIPSNRLSPGAVSIPQAPGGVRATAEVFGGGQGSEALARAAAAWANTAAVFKQARAETTFQNEKLTATVKIGEFERGLTQRSDWDKFEPEFDGLVKGIWKDYEERIDDPDVLQALKENLAKVSLQRSAYVSKHARDKEIEWGKGAYAGRQAEYLNLFATTQDPDERTRIVNDARADIRATIGAGYLKPEEGVKDLGKFLERTSVQIAQEEIRQRPEEFNPDRFPFLSPEHRISLGDQAARRVEQNERERVRLEEKAEKQREKQQKEFEEQNARNMWVALDKGLTIVQVEEGIRKRLIPLDEGKALLKAMKAEDRTEDPLQKFALRVEVEEGRAGKREILSAFNSGIINRKTTEDYLGKYYTRQRADDVSKSPEWKDAEHYITNNLKTTGPMSQFDTYELPRIEAAKDEFEQRVRKGEPIRDVRDDIVTRYRPQPLGVEAFPRPMFGSREDPATAYRETERAFRKNRIQYDVYRREILNLKKIQEVLDRNAATNPASAAEAKKKLKARKE